MDQQTHLFVANVWLPSREKFDKTMAVQAGKQELPVATVSSAARRGGRGKTPMRGKTPYSIIFYKDRKQAEDTDVFSFIL